MFLIFLLTSVFFLHEFFERFQDDDDRVDMTPPPPSGPLVPRFHGSTPTTWGSSSSVSVPLPQLPPAPSSSLPPRGGPRPSTRSIRGGRRRY